MCSLFMASLASASNFASDSFKTKSGKELTITFIKHGSLMLTYDNHSIQVDPVSEYADYTTFPKADIILITHEHGDHLDPKAIQAVEKNSTEIIANENSQKKLGKGKVLKNGDTDTSISYMKIEAVPAYNTTPGRDKYHPRHRDNGYILTFDGLRVYNSRRYGKHPGDERPERHRHRFPSHQPALYHDRPASGESGPDVLA